MSVQAKRPPRHTCLRCGLESSQDRWWDQHPVAAVSFGLPAGFVLVCIMLAYWWFTIPVTIIVCAILLNLAERRRAAIAARADHEHRELMARAVFTRPAPAPATAITRRAPSAPTVMERHVMNRWPTTPVPTQPIRGSR